MTLRTYIPRLSPLGLLCGLLTGCTAEPDHYIDVAVMQYGHTIDHLNACLASVRSILPHSKIATIYAVDNDPDQAKFTNYAKVTSDQVETLNYFENGIAGCYDTFRAEAGSINPRFAAVVLRYMAKRANVVRQAEAGQLTWAVMNQTVAKLNEELTADMNETARTLRRVTVHMDARRTTPLRP